ncbi:unnamed protein product [Rotaria sp. Silwood2]|nr:unnamed protein product [Rotaria sp. Silwood2]CAF4178583.1 unnamed protein product [Rotaria sp. Silwood2]
MRRLLYYFKSYLEFYQFDLEQTLSTTITSNNNHKFRDLINELNGIIDQSINNIEANTPQVKTYLVTFINCYATVAYFNIIDIERHRSAIKQARSRDAWKSALLKNPNTQCNGLLPLWET